MNSGVPQANGHHTAMTSFIGEPLAVGLILHYLKSQGKAAQLISWKVTPGTRKGQRLDAWIFDGVNTLYQTEIKMWAGNALDGLRLQGELSEAELLQRGQKQWLEHIWNEAEQTFQALAIGKVLGKMRPPQGFEQYQIEPMVTLWWLVIPDANAGAWFRVPVRGGIFTEANVFSLTRYLMGLKEDVLELEMPLLEARLSWLNQIFPA